MATKWISVCDFCGKEETAGDDASQSLFDMPSQPDNAYFRFTHKEGSGAENQELRLDLCGRCGAALMAQLNKIVPARYWNLEDK